MKYVYPHLPSIRTYPFIRIAGSGLANSLFVYARSLIFAEREDLKLINPTWISFDPVQWKVGAKDKRTYLGLFKVTGISGLKKWWILTFCKRVEEAKYSGKDTKGDYVRIFHMRNFNEIINDVDFVKKSLRTSLKPKILAAVDAFDFKNTIAVHIRLGDYGSASLPISYYKRLVEQIHNEKPHYRFLLFSDGHDSELAEILSLSCVERVFFGSSIADIFGIASTKALIASHSTFSDWGGI